MPSFYVRPTTEALVLAAATLLAACGMGTDLQKASQKPAETLSRADQDLAITAEVKKLLARDSQLSALVVHVQTREGRALLRGTAPDTDTRTHAAALAQTVTGVVAVQNDLSVQVVAK